ncbi:MAG: hypothetical protein V1849_01185 [Chloroflexota bacterium]
MKKLGGILSALLAGLLMPMLIWVGAASALYQRQKRASLTCSVDNECPPGFVCMSGYCVPER